jgi:hypothetical protein
MYARLFLAQMVLAIFKPIMEISVPFPLACAVFGKVSVRLIAGGKCMRGRIIGAFECCCCCETTKKVFLALECRTESLIRHGSWEGNLDRGRWRSTQQCIASVSYTRRTQTSRQTASESEKSKLKKRKNGRSQHQIAVAIYCCLISRLNWAH